MADHPAVQAAKLLRGEIDQIIMNPSVKPGSTEWFKMQAWSFGLSMLRRMIENGSHNDPIAAEVFRNAWRSYMVPEEFEVPPGPLS